MVLLKAEITVLKAMCGVYVGSLFLSAPTPLLDLTRGRLLVMSEVGSENKISHAPGRAAAPASPKLLLHTLPAALLLALKQPPCNPSHSRVRKARGPRRDKPIVLLAAIRGEMLTL